MAASVIGAPFWSTSVKVGAIGLPAVMAGIPPEADEADAGRHQDDDARRK